MSKPRRVQTEITAQCDCCRRADRPVRDETPDRAPLCEPCARWEGVVRLAERERCAREIEADGWYKAAEILRAKVGR